MRNFAQRLVAHEMNGDRSSEAKARAAFHVSEKLRPHLATLMGNGGFRALNSRALALAKAEVPVMHGLQVKADGALEGLEELHAQLDSGKFFESGVVLLAQLLGLLVAFIGEDLTLRLAGEIWPKVSLNDLNSDNGTKNGKAK
jgi:hypothetical protein